MILLDPLARLVIAHRGASGMFPENTLLAFRRALDAGAHALELDVNMSSDDVPLVIHDSTLDRTTSGRGAVRARTSGEVQRLDAGQGEPVPTLADVLESFVDVPLIVELKDPAAAPAVSTMLKRTGAVKRVLVGSFRHAAVTPCRRAGVTTAASRRDTAVFWAMSRTTVRRARRQKYQAFTVPEWWRSLRVVDRRFIDRARNADLPVHVWTVDEPAAATRLWQSGVSGIMTNVPERLLPLLS